MIKYIYLIILVSVAITGIILAVILAYHSKKYYNNKKFMTVRRRLDPFIKDYIDGRRTVSDIAVYFRGDFLQEQRILDLYLEKDKNNVFLIRKLSLEIGLTDYLINELHVGNKRKQINAIVFLGRIKEIKALPGLREKINEKDERILLSSVWSIARIGKLDLFVPVLSKVFTETHMTFEGITELMIHFGPEICRPIEELIRGDIEGEIILSDIFGVDKNQVLSLLIDILGYFKYKKGIELFQELLKPDQDQELIIHIFKSLYKMGAAVDNDLLYYILHVNWVVRSQALKYIGKVNDTRYKDILSYLLLDRKWWVRYYAADALYKLGEINLLKINLRTNKETGEICKYILAKYRALNTTG